MTVEQLIKEIEPLGSSRTKKRYMSQGAQEPLFGMTIKALKPFAKTIKTYANSQQFAYDLFNTGNYDLMYLAGMIVDPEAMSEDKYDEWMDKAYFYMIGDYTVAICLSETTFAESIADRWIESNDDLRISAGYATYSWMLGNRKDDFFNTDKLKKMLQYVEQNIEGSPNRTKYAMHYFVYNLGVSYLPLHEAALKTAANMGEITVTSFKNETATYNTKMDIEKQIQKGKIGFKRPHVRC